MKASLALLAVAAVAASAQITCETQRSDCDLQIGANHACCSSLYLSCTAGTTSPDSSFGECTNGPPCPTCTATVPAATATSVSSACAAQRASCDTQVGANHACCSSLYSSCLAGTTFPESPFSQCSNGPPCPTCTGVASTGTTSTAGPLSSSTSPATYPAGSPSPSTLPATYPAGSPSHSTSPTTYPAGSSSASTTLTTSIAGSSSPSTSPITYPAGSSSPPASTSTYPAGSLSPPASTGTTPIPFTGAANAYHVEGGLFAVGLAIAALL